MKELTQLEVEQVAGGLSWSRIFKAVATAAAGAAGGLVCGAPCAAAAVAATATVLK